MRNRLIIKIVVLTILIFATGCASTGGQGTVQTAQPAVITAISIADNQLSITADKPFIYTVYKSADPYKVIVELADVRVGGFTSKIISDKAGITEVTPSQVEEPLSAKLEVLLASPTGVEPVYKNNELIISVKEESVTAKTEEPVVKPEQKTPMPTVGVKEEPVAPTPEQKPIPREIPSATSIVQVNVERGEDALKIIIKGNGSLSPDVFRLDNRAVLDMPNVKMAASLPTAVAPLKGIRAGKHKDKTRLVLDLREGTSFDVAAVEDSVIVSLHLPEKERLATKTEKVPAPTDVETKTAIVEPEKAVSGKYKGQRISLDFQDADIGPIFRLLADISGYNFVIDPAVRGKITMKLMNVPWDQALDIILQTFSLGKSVEGNIIWIAPTTTFAKMAKEKTEAKDVEEKAEDITQEVVRINYATAAEVNTAITQGKLLSSRGSITTDTRMNTLIIKDTQKSINKIKDLVKIMDVPKPQVMIEAKLVQVSSGYSRTLGIQWGGTFEGTGIKGLGQEVSGGFAVNTPVVSASPSLALDPGGGVLGMTIGSASKLQVQLSLSALETVNKAKTLSNPKILTLDNESATIQQGRTFFVQTVSAEGTKAEEKSATLSLNVKPKIAPNDYVQLDITASDDTLESVSPPVVNKKSITTKALVKNGETLVIGGIYTVETTEGETGVPLLSRIPILGWLFKKTSQTGPDVKELLIFITPTIVSRSF